MDRPVRSLARAWVFYLVVLFAFIPPYWSLMDDVSNLTLTSEQWREKSLLTAVGEFVESERPLIGMVRPVYPAFVYVFYKSFSGSAALAYSVLGVLMLALFWGWARLYHRLEYSDTSSALFFVLCLIFTPHFNLFFHASLLEKFVVLSALLQIGIVTAALQSNKPLTFPRSLGVAALLTGSMAIGFFSKPNTIFIFAPLILLIFKGWLDAKEKGPWVLLAILTLAITASYGAYFMSIRQGYTSRYDLSHVWEKLLHPGTRFLIMEGIAVVGLWVASRTPRRIEGWIWPVGLLAFLFVMMGWDAGIGGYYVVPGGVFAAGCLAQGLRWAFSNRQMTMFAILFVGSLASGLFFYRRLSTHHSTQDVVRWLQALPPEDRVAGRLFMPKPCSEESGSVAQYSRTPVQMLGQDSVPEASQPGNVYVITHPNCLVRPINGFDFENLVFQKAQWQIYRQEGTIRP